MCTWTPGEMQVRALSSVLISLRISTVRVSGDKWQLIISCALAFRDMGWGMGAIVGLPANLGCGRRGI